MMGEEAEEIRSIIKFIGDMARRAVEEGFALIRVDNVGLTYRAVPQSDWRIGAVHRSNRRTEKKETRTFHQFK
ncbi:conserved hypothetical protein [Ricinus communis]|uniref:Uncharacterized protein n=1 Tax=Ricinus communis TaxID=3988 RepID=B9RYE2_RICCO|nr:conserved hypothetical protein [Ricinus communis]